MFFTIALGLFASHASAQLPITDTWQFKLRKPAEGWTEPKFDDQSWQTGNGGFGTRDTPGARVSTLWRTKNIWLRKSFELQSLPEQPALLLHHDEDAEIYLNGQQVAALEGWISEYKVVPLDGNQRQALRVGKNVHAVHRRQTDGGQFIDVHVIDAQQVPKLPRPPRDLTPFQSELITTWGADVTAENAWTEYPRPQLVRPNWTNLNGHWDYAITKADQTTIPAQWTGKILVPFSLESKLSGVQRMLDTDEALWYHRTFSASVKPNRRTKLHFEAVDYLANVYVNNQLVGTHQGGNDPFSIDVTDALHSGENQLIVHVLDETEGWQLRGKQTLYPRGIWYTQVSGIWQTVWIEEVAATHITDVTIHTDAASGKVNIQTDVDGQPAAGLRYVVVIKDGDQSVAEQTSDSSTMELTVDQPKLWSPASPHLYDVHVSLQDTAGKTLDSVKSYTGIRTVGKTRDADGHLRLTLNGETVFHWGPLDQGWWPDGLLTPPSDEAMLFDIEYLQAAGFNMIRKHIKVEPRRYYYHCDRLGMLVWQDQVSGGKNPPWTRLDPNPIDAEWPSEPHQQFMLELERMIDALENHPSIVVWTPFNEAWGQHQTVEVGQWVQQRDPSRSVNIASGGNFLPVGDIVDHHQYPDPGFPFDPAHYQDFVRVVGEFGGHGLPVQGHLWDANRNNWGYGGLPKNKAEYKQRYVQSIKLLNQLRSRGIAAGVYTQTTDVEGEINGLMTYDRKVIKIPASELAELHKLLFEPAPNAKAVSAEAR